MKKIENMTKKELIALVSELTRAQEKKPSSRKSKATGNTPAPAPAQEKFLNEVIVPRAQHKEANRALAADLRAHGLVPNGDVWAYAKANGVAKTVKKFAK